MCLFYFNFLISPFTKGVQGDGYKPNGGNLDEFFIFFQKFEFNQSRLENQTFFADSEKININGRCFIR